VSCAILGKRLLLWHPWLLGSWFHPNRFTKWGVRFKPPTLPSFTYGGFFKLKDKFISKFDHHTIVVKHGGHVWNHQRASLVFKGGLHHQIGWFYLGVWQLVWSSHVRTLHGMEGFILTLGGATYGWLSQV
jgi:hypothetical protein